MFWEGKKSWGFFVDQLLKFTSIASKSKLGDDGITKGDLGIFLLLLMELQEVDETFLILLILLACM